MVGANFPEMNRREALKVLASLGAIALLPNRIYTESVNSQEFHFVGLGGGGCNALENIRSKGVRAKYTCVTNPIRPHLPKDVEFIKFVTPTCFDRKEMGSLSYGNIEDHTALDSQIKNVFSADSFFILLTALGGYTGTKLTRELAEHLIVNNKHFMIICSTPFKFEGKMNISIAEKVREQLTPLPNFHCFELGSLREVHGNMKLSEAFSKADEQFYSIFKGNVGQFQC